MKKYIFTFLTVLACFWGNEGLGQTFSGTLVSTQMPPEFYNDFYNLGIDYKSLKIDSKGNKWFYYESGYEWGLYKLSNGRLTKYSNNIFDANTDNFTPRGPSYRSGIIFVIDAFDNIWITTLQDSSFFYLFDGQNWKLFTYSEFYFDYFSKINVKQVFKISDASSNIVIGLRPYYIPLRIKPNGNVNFCSDDGKGNILNYEFNGTSWVKRVKTIKNVSYGKNVVLGENIYNNDVANLSSRMEFIAGNFEGVSWYFYDYNRYFLVKVIGENATIYLSEESLRWVIYSTDFSHISTDSQDNLWYTSADMNLVKFDGNNAINIVKTSNDISAENPQVILDHNNNRWFYSSKINNQRSLYKIEESGNVTILSIPNSIININSTGKFDATIIQNKTSNIYGYFKSTPSESKLILYSENTTQPTLNLSATTQNALATASTTNITLNTNNNWTASSNATWLKVSPTSGNAATTLAVNFTIDANTTATARTGIVTFTAGGLTQTYTVTQTGVIAPVLTLSATAQNVMATANITGSSITLTANNTWSASSSVSWLKVNPTTGNSGTNLAINFPIEANTATTIRTGVVTFTSGKLTQTYTVTQAGTVAPTLTLSVSAQNVSATASTTNLTLTTNNSWTTTNNATWIKVSPSSGNAGTNLAVGFTIEANNGTSERVGTITFSAGGLTKTCTITQAGTITPSLTLSVSVQSVSANASTTNLLLTANNNWTANSNVTWLKVSPTSGNATSTNLTVNFTIDANNNTVARVGIVTFTANGLTKTYTVTQAATVSPQLSISTTAQNVVATANTTSLTLTSNNSWTANSNVSWLKVSPSSGNNGTNLTISFTIEANTSTTIRTGIVTFTAGGLTQTCTVTQAGASTLTFTFLQPLGNQQVLPKSILAIKATGEWANEISFSVGIYEKATSKLIQQLSTNTSTQQLKDGINYTLNDLAPAQYDLKVQGNNQKTLSGSVVIEIVNNASTIDLLWDYETNRTLSNKKPLGVAADGTARLLLKITPNATVASRVKKITAELQNPTNGAIINSSYLGKVMATNKTNSSYSEEANTANTITANNTTISTDGSFYFWYVAPDDFASAGIDELSAERKIRCIISLFENSNTALSGSEISISVVRPPLALVHGLGGSPTTYDNFGYGAYSVSVLFKDDSRFKVRKALNLYPSDAFEKNANVLLAKDNTKLDQSLAFLIDDMRIKGYACNRVDYVGHSMGGCVLRYATQLSDWKSNLNYNKGYVNKFITLDTPHQGSPLGDIVSEFASSIPIENELLFSLILSATSNLDSYFKINGLKVEATGAVKNFSLRESNGGVKLKETVIKNHEIIGDYVKNFSPTHFALIFTGDVLKTGVGLPILANTLSDGALSKFKKCNCKEYNEIQFLKENTLTNAYFVQEFLNWQAKRVANLNNFFQNSDIIVGTESQAAGQLSLKLPSQTVLKANHAFGDDDVTKNLQAGNRVYELLNAPINGNLFSNVIPATPIYPNVYSCGTTDCKNTNGRLAANEQTLDTTKIKIISPGRLSGTTFFAGTNQYIQVQLKDTTGFRFLELNLGLLRLRTADKKSIVSMLIQVPADIIGKQDLRVKGVYRDKNGNYQEYEDMISVTVQTNEQPQALQVLPTSLKLNVGQKNSLSIVATYAQSQSLWLAPYSNITAEYDNTLLSIDTKTMIITGKKAGKTTIILTISNGKKYNVTVEIVQPIVILGNEDPTISQENKITIYPNPTKKDVTVELQSPKPQKATITIHNLQGQKMEEVVYKITQRIEKVPFSIGQLPTGVYIVQTIFEDGQKMSLKLLIDK